MTAELLTIKLREVTEEIGHASVCNKDKRLAELYEKLSEALDYAELVGLIEEVQQ